MARPGIHYTALNIKLQKLGAMMNSELRLDKTAGRYRVELADGAEQISPRLTGAAMLDWIEAGLAVVTHMGRGFNKP